jgi:hypothetical protein
MEIALRIETAKAIRVRNANESDLHQKGAQELAEAVR